MPRGAAARRVPLAVLIVTAGGALGRIFGAVVGSGWTAIEAQSLATARVVLETGRADVAIAQHVLPDGSSLDLLRLIERLPRRATRFPVLVVADAAVVDTINAVQLLGAEVVCGAQHEPNVRAFLRRCSADVGALALVRDLAQRAGLTDAEARIVRLAVDSAAHEHLRSVARISSNTLKTHIRAILGKTGAQSLEDLARPLRGLALHR